MTSDWDEIKRLAADFQKVQLTSTLQKLSERNCVEIVALLLENQLLKAVFTNDGKEYVTPEHLEREILDELYHNDGRVNLVEVSKTLNVDYSQIEEIAHRLAAENKNIYFMLGQLINDDYLTHVAEEINEKLMQHGEFSISDLTQQLELPADFLQRHLCEKHLGKTIRGRQDAQNPSMLFTQAYLQRCKAKLRGAVAAITRPTNVSTILQQTGLPEKIYHTLSDELSIYGFVTSKLSNAQFIPHIFSEMQVNWALTFYKQNGFLEYEDINKLGISDVKQFIQKVLPNENLVFLQRFALGSKIIDLTLLTAINECSNTNSYVDLSTLLPSNLEDEDIEEIFNKLLKQKLLNSNLVFMNNIVFSEPFINTLVQPCHDMAYNLAKNAIDSGTFQKHLADKMISEKNHNSNMNDDDANMKRSDKRDERRKKALTGKLGGGAQGRETKTKSTKKHSRGARHAIDSSDDENAQLDSVRSTSKKLELVTLANIVDVIIAPLENEGLEHLAKPLAALHLSKINQLALKHAEELHLSVPQTGARRNTHASTQEKVNNLLIDMRLYDKGLKLFPDDVHAQLTKYLLKSLGNDICIELITYVANECNLVLKNSNNLKIEQCLKIVLECDDEYRTPLNELLKSINRSVDEFLLCTETVLKTCSMVLKKVDKKKDRQLIVQHKEKLLQQLQSIQEPPLVLHLTVLILFTTVSGCILHASGKFVAQILKYLHSFMSVEDNLMLQKYHDMVCSLLQTSETTTETKFVNEELFAVQDKIKNLAETYQKPGVFKTT